MNAYHKEIIRGLKEWSQVLLCGNNIYGTKLFKKLLANTVKSTFKSVIKLKYSYRSDFEITKKCNLFYEC